MSHLISPSTFAKRSVFKCINHVPPRQPSPTRKQTDIDTWPPTVFPIKSIPVAASASRPICLFHFHFQAEQTLLSFLPFFPSFVCQCNCTSSRNRKELRQSVKKPAVKTSLRQSFSHLGGVTPLFRCAPEVARSAAEELGRPLHPRVDARLRWRLPPSSA